MRSHVARWPTTFWLVFGNAICLAQPTGMVIEPFRLISREVIFEGDEVNLKEAEQAKLEALAQSIFQTYAAPVHECDFDVFLFEGFRRSESGANLQRLDRLFERRVASLKKLLAQWGISERVGVTIKPSEARLLPESNPNSVAIEIRYWIHRKGEKYESSHLDCKWPLSR